MCNEVFLFKLDSDNKNQLHRIETIGELKIHFPNIIFKKYYTGQINDDNDCLCPVDIVETAKNQVLNIPIYVNKVGDVYINYTITLNLDDMKYSNLKLFTGLFSSPVKAYRVILDDFAPGGAHVDILNNDIGWMHSSDIHLINLASMLARTIYPIALGDFDE